MKIVEAKQRVIDLMEEFSGGRDSNILEPSCMYYGTINGKVFKTNKEKVFFDSPAAVKKAMKTSTLFSCIHNGIFDEIFQENWPKKDALGNHIHSWDVDCRKEEKLALKKFNEFFNLLVENKVIEFKRMDF